MDGGLRIEICGPADKPDVRLARSGAISPAVIMKGKPVEAVPPLISRIFNLCPMAHTAAASLALGLTPATGANARLASEILREHAIVMLRDWPLAMGRAIDPAPLKGLTALYGDRLEALEQQLFGEPAAGFLQRETLTERNAASVPLGILAEVAEWRAEWGRLEGEVDPTFFVRCLSDEHVRGRLGNSGPTLALRMIARLREAARLIGEMRTGGAAPRFGQLKDGAGWAEAARGRLEHHAVITEGKIADYTILTPTDAMIAPGGLLGGLLRSALSAPEPLRRKVFAMALAAADPCVGVEVVWETA